MAKRQSRSLVHAERIEQSILLIRGHKVLLDADLAQLYGVEISALNRAVKRNLERFPDDFMFHLAREEWAGLRYQIGTLDEGRQTESSGLRSQSVTLSPGRGRHRKYLPYAFTEQGVAMLSSVLRSQRAVQVNIEIMRAFVRLRSILAFNAELASRLDEVEKHLGHHDQQFIEVIRAIRQLMEPPPRPSRRRIGFDVPRERHYRCQIAWRHWEGQTCTAQPAQTASTGRQVIASAGRPGLMTTLNCFEGPKDRLLLCARLPIRTSVQLQVSSYFARVVPQAR